MKGNDFDFGGGSSSDEDAQVFFNKEFVNKCKFKLKLIDK
jgi:hypothetical protein